MDRKRPGKNVDGPPTSGNPAYGDARGCADRRGAFHLVGNFWATHATRNDSGIGGGGAYRGAERFHRGIPRLVRADGKERNPLG